MGVAGYSMGGTMAAFTAAAVPFPVAAVPAATGCSAAYVYCEGLLSLQIRWDRLGDSARAVLAERFERVALDRLPAPARPAAAVLSGGATTATSTRPASSASTATGAAPSPGGAIGGMSPGRLRAARSCAGRCSTRSRACPDVDTGAGGGPVIDTVWEALAVLGVGVLSGGINALAGGGTLSPSRCSCGSGCRRSRRARPTRRPCGRARWPAPGGTGEIADIPRFWLWTILPALAGGVAGGCLLVGLSPTVFQALAPFLVMGAALLVAVEGPIRSRLGLGEGGGDEVSPARKVAAIVVVALIAVYGGYFGAGIGILLLAGLALTGVHRIHHANGLKNLLSAAMKGAAVVAVAVAGKVVWPAAPSWPLAPSSGATSPRRSGGR